MTRFTIEIDCDNTAFDDSPQAEIIRILREAADRLEVAPYEKSIVLSDINGNHVGTACLHE